MPPINATVNWDAGKSKGTVDDIRVPAANGATVINWSCGTNVVSFGITGLDTSEFSPAASNGQVTNFSTTDTNEQAKTYTYTVSATHKDGRTSSHDPKIENGT
jgi:hypothetical protein